MFAVEGDVLGRYQSERKRMRLGFQVHVENAARRHRNFDGCGQRAGIAVELATRIRIARAEQRVIGKFMRLNWGALRFCCIAILLSLIKRKELV